MAPMTTDPRLRMNANTGSGGLLLAGDDAMEEDEDLFGGDDDDGQQQHRQNQQGVDGGGPALVPQQPPPPPLPVPLPPPPPALSSSSIGIVGSVGSSSSGTDRMGVTPASSSSSSTHFRPVELISSIITPSPFPHHTSGPTASRYRNSLQRIQANPRTDTEAWQALIGEASTCFRTLQSQGPAALFAFDAETQLRLDWVESCYGSLLKHFPYSCTNIAAVGEVLYILSAHVGEDGGPQRDYGGLLSAGGNSQRSQSAQQKLQTLLALSLGYDLDGHPITFPPPPSSQSATTTTTTATTATGQAPEEDGNGQQQQQQQQLQQQRRRGGMMMMLSPQLGGMCTSSVELWLLYVKTRCRYMRRKSGLPPNFASMTSMAGYVPTPQQLDAARAVLEDTKAAYALALRHAGYTCFDNHVLWRSYVDYAKSQAPVIAQSELDRNASMLLMTPQQHMTWLRSIYQDLVCHPMKGLDQLWKEYEDFEKSHSEQLAAALIPEWLPKYHHARNVYLERLNRVFNPDDLKWKDSWATPPVSSIHYEDEDDGGEEFYYDEMSGRTVPVDSMDMLDGSATDAASLKKRKRKRWQKIDGVGSAGGGGGGAADGGGGLVGGGDDGTTTFTQEDYQNKLRDELDYMTLWKKRVAFERTDPERITNTLELANRVRSAYKEMICVLTLYPEAWHMWSMWEDLQAPSSRLTADVNGDINSATQQATTSNAIAVLQLGQGFLPDSTLLVHAESQLVETHAALADGKAPIGAVPSDCLRVWEQFLDRAPNSLAFCIYQRLVRRYQGVDAARKVFSRARRVLASSHSSSYQLHGGPEKESGSTGVDGDSEESTKHGKTKDNGNRTMVTNRLDPSVGKQAEAYVSSSGANQRATKYVRPGTIYIGPITWHLYASHATIEHRVNKLPETAARIYELGLRKHSSFLTKPTYILKYGQLLMELQDTVNLRALLTRALAACGDLKTPHVESLWDMTLQCEELWSVSDPSNLDNIISVERKRRAALLGKEVEDVATGLRVDGEESKLGSQNTSLSELLIGNDGSGYNVSSMIVNGMNRSVDVLDVMGLWGDGSGAAKLHSSILNFGTLDDDAETISGGKSDRSYNRRTHYTRKVASGAGTTSMGTSGLADTGGTKTATARERFQQQSGQQNAPIQLAIQQSPDWLRPFLLLLPASRLRGMVVKAPPHMVEMALSSLRNSQLPAERPDDGADNTGSLAGSKRSSSRSGGGGDDSDEDDSGPSGSGGYGTTFRARQRAKLMSMNS